ncbi:MAG TPA: hypothetical protein VGO78_17280 [Acidimicrobiales bacterium]|nr:hypothetical protein [Acidimicrobiales bacterium]
MGDDQGHRVCRRRGPLPGDPVDALAASVRRGAQLDVEVDSGRLSWWWTRRQLRRRQGIISTPVAGPSWRLRRPPP